MVTLKENYLVDISESCFGVRHVQTLLVFFAMILGLCMRVNMSLAIVDMTDSSKANSFDWSIQTQSVILSSFFWGYLVLQVPGGMLAGKFGVKWPMFSIIALNSLLCFATPFAANYGGWKLVCACRTLQGLAQGSLYPCAYNFLAKWAPMEEKSRTGTLVYAGATLGTGLQSMYAGFVANSLGWEYIFYINGILGTIWSVCYYVLGASSPAAHKSISKTERMYIERSIGSMNQQKNYSVPWKAMFTSLSFLSLIFANVGQNWGFWTLMTMMPSYMKQVLNVDIQTNGVVSAIPNLVMFAAGFPLGFLSDYVINKKCVKITIARKISNTVGFWGPALALIWMSYSPAGNLAACVALLSLVVGLNAGHYTGFGMTHIDMAPNFASVMMGVTNGMGAVASLIAPLVAGLLLDDETSVSDWRKVFYLSSLIYFIANLIYLVFGSNERQWWNEPISDTKQKEKEETISTP